jgi:uncharacterized protein
MRCDVEPMPSSAIHPAAAYNRSFRSANDVEALHSLEAAAESGCIRAQFLVGLAYHTGRGVALDFEQAARWYRKAAGGGDGHAIANLGIMSLLGQGAAADEVDAYTWLQSAVGLGHEWLRPALEVLERRITGSPDAADAAGILAAIAPEVPALGPCTQPGCDPSRCTVV